MGVSELEGLEEIAEQPKLTVIDGGRESPG
jgi:hypothetical protein